MNIKLGLILIVLFCISACRGGGGGGSYPDKIIATAFTVSEYNAPQAPNTTLAIDPQATIDAADFIIEVRLVPKSTTTESSLYNLALQHQLTFSLFNSTHADPAPPLAQTNLDQIKITSNAKFSNDYPAGSSLNDLFSIEYLNGLDFFGQGIEDITDPIKGGAHSLKDLHLQLRLTQPPSESLTHSFSIQVNYTPFDLEEITFN